MLRSLFNVNSRDDIDLNLNRIEKALDLINNPCKKIPGIQIIGTNGKGSIASFLESCLLEKSIKVGCTTSPHIFDWCERIRVAGTKITKKEFETRIYNIHTKSKNLTQFELVIACALDYFEYKNVELIILEAGLGGRLDATTAHPYRPIIGIGSIDLDHCEYLGNSIEEITYEKGATISPGSIVVSSIQKKKVEIILEKLAYKNNAKIKWVKALSQNWELGIPGEIQRNNAAVAKGILEELVKFGWKLEEKNIINGLKNASWPARLQKVSWQDKPLLLDGAHNPGAARILAKERSLWDGNKEGVHWIIGIQSHKNGPEIIKSLIKEKDLAWIVPVPNHQSWTKSNLEKSCPELSGRLNQSNSIEEVLERFLLFKEWPKPCPVITGSLYIFENLSFYKEIISNL